MLRKITIKEYLYILTNFIFNFLKLKDIINRYILTDEEGIGSKPVEILQVCYYYLDSHQI